jgi:hypothetical protein
MVSDKLKEKAEQARRDGYVVFGVHEGPMLLGPLLELVKDLFPNHTLDQLAVIEADDGEFVIGAQLGIQTKSN